MKRTADRPLPTERMSIQQAIAFTIITGSLGLGFLYFGSNLIATSFGLLSMILYGFVYTPLKQKTPLAVLVGAIPGAMPPLIGWVAATGVVDSAALIFFGIQFIWQFPHFWAIAWVLDEDYKKAGFKLLPSAGGKDINTAFQIMTYTLFLIPLGLLPAYFGITGVYSAVIATVCGTLFLVQTFQLMRSGSQKAALKIMFASFLYLPIIQISYWIDKL